MVNRKKNQTTHKKGKSRPANAKYNKKTNNRKTRRTKRRGGNKVLEVIQNYVPFSSYIPGLDIGVIINKLIEAVQENYDKKVIIGLINEATHIVMNDERYKDFAQKLLSGIGCHATFAPILKNVVNIEKFIGDFPVYLANPNNKDVMQALMAALKLVFGPDKDAFGNDKNTINNLFKTAQKCNPNMTQAFVNIGYNKGDEM